VVGDAERLPLAAHSADGYTIAFGIRNVTRIDAALAEAFRARAPSRQGNLPAHGPAAWRKACDGERSPEPRRTRAYMGHDGPLVSRAVPRVAGDLSAQCRLAQLGRRTGAAPRACSPLWVRGRAGWPAREHGARGRAQVLRPGGQFLCLEFSQLVLPGLRELYDAYSFNVIPRIGRRAPARSP